MGALDHTTFSVMGFELLPHADSAIMLTQRMRQQEIDPDRLATNRNRETLALDRPTTSAELDAYRYVIGQMLSIDRMNNPILLSQASSMTTKIKSLHTRHLNTLLTLLNFYLQRVSSILFRAASKTPAFELEVVSDASIYSSSEGGGRRAYVISLVLLADW